MNKQLFKYILYSSVFPVIFVSLYLMSRNNYLLYHGIVELAGIVIAGGVFMIALNSRSYMQNDFFVVIGVSFFFVAALDFLHLMSYKGMGVFPGISSNVPTQFWISSGYLRAFTFLAAPLFITRNIKTMYVLVAYFITTSALIFSILFLRVFPDCFIDGYGLTAFKISSEYIIACILALSIIYILKKKDSIDRSIGNLFISALVVTIVSGMAFTLYTDVYGFSNFIGHILKLVAYGLIYMSVIQTGLRKPFDFLLRDLKQNEEKLLNALSEIKTLHGILPICASCKKIRNDKGYWQMVEEYISEHTDAKFTHGICRECAENLYPDIFNEENNEEND